MTTANTIAAALRPLAPAQKLMPADVPLIDQLAALWDARRPAVSANRAEPAWTTALRGKIGEREIPGTKHNPWIATGWQRLGAKWFNDDETPWCGFAIAWSLDQAGLPFPKEFPRAASYSSWGAACAPQMGAIGVKSRKGGNHVFQIVGETPDRLYYKALSGNQGNMVSIIDILKSDVDAIRWPAEAGAPLGIPLPKLPKGTVGASEA